MWWTYVATKRDFPYSKAISLSKTCIRFLVLPDVNFHPSCFKLQNEEHTKSVNSTVTFLLRHLLLLPSINFHISRRIYRKNNKLQKCTTINRLDVIYKYTLQHPSRDIISHTLKTQVSRIDCARDTVRYQQYRGALSAKLSHLGALLP